MKQFQQLKSHQVFSVLTDIIPLWTCKAVLSFHYHSHHDQLLPMPERRTADEPSSTYHMINSGSKVAQL